MDNYALSLILNKAEGEMEFEYENLLSSIPRLWDMIDLEADIVWQLKERNDLKALADGDYLLYISGDVWFESDRDWESGAEEGGFAFNVSFLYHLPLPKEDEGEKMFCAICKDEVFLYQNYNHVMRMSAVVHSSCLIERMKKHIVMLQNLLTESLETASPTFELAISSKREKYENDYPLYEV